MGKTFKGIEIIRPFIRNGSFPIDTTTLFYSYDDAVTYAHSDPNAYAGQIITIDDSSLRKVGVYIVDYDKTKTFNYVISPIETSNSTGSVLFNWKGSVDDTEDLPNFSVQGDVYLVKNEHKFYVAYEQPDDSVLWSEMTLGVDYATVTTDGIITKETYTAMTNTSGKQAVWFNAGIDDVDQNKWIGIDSTDKEESTHGDFKIPSIGKVKQLIATMTKTILPHIAVETGSDIDHPISIGFTPDFIIKYYPEFGGNVNSISIYKKINGELDQDPVFTIDNVITGEFDELNQCYTYYYMLPEQILYNEATNITYKIIVHYDESKDGDIPAGMASDEITFHVYNSIFYGTNLDTYSMFCTKIENENRNLTIELEYDPTEYDAPLYEIFIKIPEYCKLTDVTYVTQYDLYAKEFFVESQEMIGGIIYNTYKYSLSEEYPFKSPGKFIFYAD